MKSGTELIPPDEIATAVAEDAYLYRKEYHSLLQDISKAFDKVDHSVLLTKLDHYGIRGSALQWIKSYLINRKQHVTVNGTKSTSNIMNYGVPQGFILGPLLSITYINDIPEIAQYAKFILYADDANIIISANTIEEVHDQLLELTKTPKT